MDPRIAQGDRETVTDTTDAPTPPSAATTRGAARVALGIYAAALLVIAVWPVPVDSGAGPMLRAITKAVPALTYARMEFGANILLFVPYGILLTLILTRSHLVVPIALVTTVAIESAQALMLDRRTPSVLDVVANTTGACIGLLLIAAWQWHRRKRAARVRRAD